ncbi:MAG: glycosyltransferase family 2 protein [Polyangiaceae bacterium]|nr:glycosyltransferase family 2 protein [Polyangiaceae bacterium]
MTRGFAAFVVPLYNHAATIGEVVERALTLDWPVFVVDDGSTDGGPARLPRDPRVRVLRHPENRGKGAALLTGLGAAAAVADYAVAVDADGQHDPREAVRLLDAARMPGRPIVIGAREGMDGPDVPFGSRFGRRFSNAWVTASGGPSISDSQSGFRAYPIPETLSLGVRSRRFQFEVELLVLARWAGIPVVEVPVSVVYQPGSARVSHFLRGRDSLRNGAVFARLIALRALGGAFWYAGRRKPPPALGGTVPLP